MARKLTALFALWALAALAPAPIKTLPPPDYKPLPAHSEAQLVEEQRQQIVKDEVGTNDLTPDEKVQSGRSSADAENTLRAAQQQKSADIVREAGQELRKEEAVFPPYVWGVLFAALGFGSVYAFRFWLNKTLPNSAGPQRAPKW